MCLRCIHRQRTEGAKNAFNLPVKMPEFAENELKKSVKNIGFDPFTSVQSQLNSLSTAAGSSNDKEFQSAVTQSGDQKLDAARDESQPTIDATGGGAKGLSGTARDNFSAKDYPMRKMKEEFEIKTSHNDEAYQAPPPLAAPPPPAMTLSALRCSLASRCNEWHHRSLLRVMHH